MTSEQYLIMMIPKKLYTESQINCIKILDVSSGLRENS